MKNETHRLSSPPPWSSSLAAAVALRLRPGRCPSTRPGRPGSRCVVTVDEEGKTRVVDRFVVAAPVAGGSRRLELNEGDAIDRGDVVARSRSLPLDARARAEARRAYEWHAPPNGRPQARVQRAATALEQAKRSNARADQSWPKRERSRRRCASRPSCRKRRWRGSSRRAVRGAGRRLRRGGRPAALLSAGADRRNGAAAQVVVRCPRGGRVLRVLQESERPSPPAHPCSRSVIRPASRSSSTCSPRTPSRCARGRRRCVDGGDGRQLPARIRARRALGLHEDLGARRRGAARQRDRRLLGASGALGDGYRVEASIIVWEGKDVLKVPGSALFRRGRRGRSSRRGRAGARAGREGRAPKRDGGRNPEGPPARSRGDPASE